ncbi:hypothetical protein ON010_g14129 [Phytophthora cinnamomi]|nr:hypothetical protein ON010_g14129 [Phytophthora cinnamomi]
MPHKPHKHHKQPINFLSYPPRRAQSRHLVAVPEVLSGPHTSDRISCGTHHLKWKSGLRCAVVPGTSRSNMKLMTSQRSQRRREFIPPDLQRRLRDSLYQSNESVDPWLSTSPSIASSSAESKTWAKSTGSRSLRVVSCPRLAPRLCIAGAVLCTKPQTWLWNTSVPIRPRFVDLGELPDPRFNESVTADNLVATQIAPRLENLSLNLWT